MLLESEGQAAPRDLSDYTKWREESEGENLALIEFYGAMLIGQYAGFSTALCLTAVASALALAEVAPAWRFYFAARLVRLHAIFEQHRPKKESA